MYKGVPGDWDNLLAPIQNSMMRSMFGKYLSSHGLEAPFPKNDKCAEHLANSQLKIRALDNIKEQQVSSKDNILNYRNLGNASNAT